MDSQEDTLLDLEAMLKAELPQQPAELPKRPFLPSPEALGIYSDFTPESMGRVQELNSYSTALVKAMEPQDPLAKALGAPPTAFSFVTMSYMPDPQSGGLMSWPGIAPGSLQKLARTNLAPEMIISTRIADVLRYSHISSHPWKPGWRIEMKDRSSSPTTWDKRDMRACESLIENCSLDGSADTPRKRDALGYLPFKKFLAAVVRDFLTYDAIALWTDMDQRGRVKGFVPVPSGNIRLADPKIGYLGNPKDFAVMVDQAGTVVQPFTRDELVWHVGNPKLDPDWGGYGWSRLDAGMRLIDAFQAAFDMNTDVFSKNSFPTGMMLLKGAGWTQNELDAIARQISNLKKGVSKIWSMPAMVVPKDSDVDFLDLNASNEKDAMYQNHMNLVMGVFALLYNFPHDRLGFRISGSGPDAGEKSGGGDDKNQTLVTADEDIGLINLLSSLEFVLNEYIIKTRFPHLQLVFSGKAPREDAREYEAKQLAETFGERRAAADLPALEELAQGPDAKKIAKLMDLAPIDPGLSGIFQSLITAYIASKEKAKNEPAKPGAAFPATKDPAKGEAHGAMSGVRRSSRKSSLLVADDIRLDYDSEDYPDNEGYPSRDPED